MPTSHSTPIVRLTPTEGRSPAYKQQEIKQLSDQLWSRFQQGDAIAHNLVKSYHPAAAKPDFKATLFDMKMVILFQQMSGQKLSLSYLKKQAKALLKAVQTEDPLALLKVTEWHPKIQSGVRASSELKLADCLHVLARENGFSSWPKLKQHIELLERLRLAPPPMDQATDIHVRCGTDIQDLLKAAGFQGQFQEISNPFTYGPVYPIGDQDGQMHRQKVLKEDLGAYIPADHWKELQKLAPKELSFLSSLHTLEGEMLLWFEHDAYDQFCLAYICHFLSNQEDQTSVHASLIQVDSFPGVQNFIGLGNLGPEPENLQLLYQQRLSVTPAIIAFGARVWTALTSSTPETLWALAREKKSPLPLMQKAILRFLRELPDPVTGLSLIETLALQTLTEEGELLLRRLFLITHAEKDPQPFQGDVMFFALMDKLLKLKKPPIKVTQKLDIPGPGTEIVTLTPFGKAVLAAQENLLSHNTVQRWIAGTEINSEFARNWTFSPRDGLRFQ